MRYYLFGYYPDEVVKKYPQCMPVQEQPDNYDIESETSRTKLNAYEFPKAKPHLSFFLEKKAGLTNLIGPSNMGTADGLLMDRSMFEIFNKYKLYNSKFYEASIVYKKDKYEYYWLHVLLDYWDTNVDFNRTTYVKQKSLTIPGVQVSGDIHEIKYSNLEEKSEDYDRIGDVRINKLFLTEDFVKEEYDFFSFIACNTDLGYFVSERLLKEMAKLKPTGCRIFKQNILEEYTYP